MEDRYFANHVCPDCGSANQICVGGVADTTAYYTFLDCNDCGLKWETDD